MKKTFLTALAATMVAPAAFAGFAQPPVNVPEAGVTGSVAALAAVAAVGVIAWERRRRNNRN